MAKGSIYFDHQQRLVTFRNVERKLATTVATPESDHLTKQIWASPIDPDYFVVNIPPPIAQPQPVPTQSIMDRMTMLQWLRSHPLTPGTNIELSVTDGHKLLGFSVTAEALATITWNQQQTVSTRLRLQPKVTANGDTNPVWIWISNDSQRLPLMFRTRRALGTFETRLVSVGTAQFECVIPEAISLSDDKSIRTQGEE
ncbi:hypothetical protein TI04_12045 [Achromatium sp. WMS2]|nr:hypothetical protein TI04_12045 [Achromatium sp. WMS2]